MNKYWSLFFIFVLVGCSSRPSLTPNEKDRIADNLMKRVALDLLQARGLQPCGTGAQMMGQVKMLALAFDYNEPLEIEEGRKLLVYAAETFVSAINSDERIHPYLYNYPFEPKNVQIRIFINNPDHSDVEPEKICILSVIDGECKYKVHDSETLLLKTVHREPFAEAKRLLKTSR